jgi:hypothetical protein
MHLATEMGLCINNIATQVAMRQNPFYLCPLRHVFNTTQVDFQVKTSLSESQEMLLSNLRIELTEIQTILADKDRFRKHIILMHGMAIQFAEKRIRTFERS